MRNLGKRKSSSQIQSLFYAPLINGALIKSFLSSGAAMSCRVGFFNLYLLSFKCPAPLLGSNSVAQSFMTY